MISVSVAVLDPDITLFHRFCDTLKQTTGDLLTEVIVVDNASQDKTYQEVATAHFGDKAKFIVNEINKGYGQAHNQAIEIAQGTYFVVCNDDIEFHGPWAAPFINILKDPNVAQVGPSNNVCNHWNTDSLGYGKESDNPDYIEGSLFMMRTELARRYGPFDPVYEYGYYEDGDLSLRLKKDGYVLKQIPIEWVHHRAKTTNRILEETDVYGYQVLNKKIFESRWYSYVIAKKFGKVIVVKREGSYGDVFLTTPVLKRLRELYPDDCIILMSRMFEPILVSDYVDAMTKMHVPIYADYFIDLDYAYEGDFKDIHIAKAYERAVRKQLREDFTIDSVTGYFRMLRDEMPEITKILPGDFNEYICVDVGESWRMKKWPDKYIFEFIRRIRNDGHKVALVGINPGPMPFDFDLNFTSSLSIEQTVYLLKASRCYVGHEGLLSHICQSLKKETITLYTCTSPEYVGDVSLIDKTLFPIISPVVCQGCRHVGAVAGTTIFCPRNYICTQKVTVDMVYDKFKEVIQ